MRLFDKKATRHFASMPGNDGMGRLNFTKRLLGVNMTSGIYSIQLVQHFCLKITCLHQINL